jgi:DNA-binding response OmpR family regulator
VKALVVDDDRVFADVVAFALRREGFEVSQAYDGLSALHRWSTEKPDLLVLDVNLPVLNGFTVCQRIRAEADTPIILLTVRCDDEDIIYGLETGADVYMTKPFSPRQLVARARAILRRSRPAREMEADRANGCLPIPENWFGLHGFSRKRVLTPLERKLLECLETCPGQTLSFETIIQEVWGEQGSDRTSLRQLVRRLRLKLEPDPAHPLYIRTIPGIGYQLAAFP